MASANIGRQPLGRIPYKFVMRNTKREKPAYNHGYRMTPGEWNFHFIHPLSEGIHPLSDTMKYEYAWANRSAPNKSGRVTDRRLPSYRRQALPQSTRANVKSWLAKDAFKDHRFGRTWNNPYPKWNAPQGRKWQMANHKRNINPYAVNVAMYDHFNTPIIPNSRIVREDKKREYLKKLKPMLTRWMDRSLAKHYAPPGYYSITQPGGGHGYHKAKKSFETALSQVPVKRKHARKSWRDQKAVEHSKIFPVGKRSRAEASQSRKSRRIPRRGVGAA